MSLSSYPSESVVDLSESPVFQYQYSSITDIITHFAGDEETLLERESYLRNMFFRNYYDFEEEEKITLQVDKTNNSKPHSVTMEGRHYIHKPNIVTPGVRPLDIGVSYSFVNISSPEGWSLPLSGRRINLDQTDSEVAVGQIRDIMKEENSALANRRMVTAVLDTAYATATYIDGVKDIDNLVSIIRFRSSSKVYKAYKKKEGEKSRAIYGEKYYLIPESDVKQYSNHPKTKQPYEVERQSIRETKADEEKMIYGTLNNGREVKIELQYWYGLLLRTKDGIKMSDKPFNLLMSRVVDAKTEELVFNKPMYVAVFGQKREELDAEQVFDQYMRRNPIEGFFRFIKRKMHFVDYQANSSQNYNNWVYMIIISVWMLFTARKDVSNAPKKWQQYGEKEKQADETGQLSMAQVYKAMQGYLLSFDLSPFAPKRSKPGPGRQKGDTQAPRKKFRYSKKTTKKTKKAPAGHDKIN